MSWHGQRNARGHAGELSKAHFAVIVLIALTTMATGPCYCPADPPTAKDCLQLVHKMLVRTVI